MNTQIGFLSANYHSRPILLRTNVPKEIMAFPGFPHPKEWTSYITREQCLEYLNMFIDHYSLRKYIRVKFRALRLLF